ncbi:hypothetical protein PSACC_02262 [Paramicrosporidium saccamoebae]|uniref:Lysosomal dipeptide transporter MFSD1 n=1 Tax=Paramicrosporidium saccamoebae TaxID=1246581 RepID=A0A2H9TJQ9_9FUNG|nr:hypothetical protein PSACC_02262 [Paramicrosporidium saccamoebae]
MPPDWLETGEATPVWSTDSKPPTPHPEYHSRIRWVVLFLSCWIMFGNYYAFDNPSALNRPLRGLLAPPGDEVLFQDRLSLLYSLYSVPNVVLPFFVGRLLDRLGSRAILLLLSFLVAAGQFLVACGLQSGNFGLMVGGRMLFGVGGESLAVAQSRLVTQWFAGKELALAIGLNLSIARVGTVVNNILSPIVAEHWSVPAAFWVGFFSCLLSLCCTVATIVVDRCYHHFHSDHEHIHKQSSSRRRAANSDFDHGFWVLATICFLFYVHLPLGVSLTRYFGGNLVDANLAMSIPDTLAMVLVPLLGIYVDRHGKRISLIMCGAVAFAVGHAMLGMGSQKVVAFLALSVLGFAYSTLLCFWACVPAVVRHARHSTAYGILTSACNLAVTLIPLAVAPIISTDASYGSCGLFFAALGATAVGLVLVLGALNLRHHLGLECPSARLRPAISLSAPLPVLSDPASSRSSTPSVVDSLIVDIPPGTF